MNHWWRNIFEQQVEALPNLWEHRDRLARSPIAKLDDLIRFDSRICAQAETLELEGPVAAELCADCWRTGRRGEIFAEALARIGWRQQVSVRHAVEIDPVVSAYGFASETAVRFAVETLRRSTAISDLDLAARILRARRLPWPYDWHFGRDQPLCRALLLLPGFTGDARAQPFLDDVASADVPSDLRAAAYWSRWVLWRSVDDLVHLIENHFGLDDMHGLARVALRLTPIALLDDVVAACSDGGRLEALALGASGQGKHLPALQRMARDPVTRSTALEGIFLMTGMPAAAKALALADEEPGIDSELDLHQDDAVNDLFLELAGNSRGYVDNQRYLCGQPVTPETSRQIMLHAPQLARAAAVVELRQDAGPAPIFNVMAPAPGQKSGLTLRRIGSL